MMNPVEILGTLTLISSTTFINGCIKKFSLIIATTSESRLSLGWNSSSKTCKFIIRENCYMFYPLQIQQDPFLILL